MQGLPHNWFPGIKEALSKNYEMPSGGSVCIKGVYGGQEMSQRYHFIIFIYLWKEYLYATYKKEIEIMLHFFKKTYFIF